MRKGSSSSGVPPSSVLHDPYPEKTGEESQCPPEASEGTRRGEVKNGQKDEETTVSKGATVCEMAGKG